LVVDDLGVEVHPAHLRVAGLPRTHCLVGGVLDGSARIARLHLQYSSQSQQDGLDAPEAATAYYCSTHRIYANII
jgi:hypothetical protein